MKNKETKLIDYTITFSKNNNSWRCQNIVAENEEQAKEIFNIGLREGIKKSFYISMDKDEREKEFNRYNIITVSRII